MKYQDNAKSPYCQLVSENLLPVCKLSEEFEQADRLWVIRLVHMSRDIPASLQD
jgi:hypothetical protein